MTTLHAALHDKKEKYQFFSCEPACERILALAPSGKGFAGKKCQITKSSFSHATLHVLNIMPYTIFFYTSFNHRKQALNVGKTDGAFFGE